MLEYFLRTHRVLDSIPSIKHRKKEFYTMKVIKEKPDKRWLRKGAKKIV